MASYRQPHQSLLHAAWNHARNRALTHQSDAGLLPLTQSPKAYPASPLFIARFSCPFGASLGARNDKKERVVVSVGLLPWDSAVVGAAGTPSFDNAPSAPPAFVAEKSHRLS